MARALFVDDHPDVATVFALMLEAHGHEARALDDGRQVAAVVAAFRPHVVYLDLSMPHVDGAAVARCLLDRADRPRVVVVSAECWRRDELLAVGVDGFIVKPPGPADLLAYLPAD